MADKTELNLARIRACDEDVWRTITDARWDESKHSRAQNGQFSKVHGARSSLPANKQEKRTNALKSLTKAAAMSKKKRPKKPKAPKYTKEEGYKNQVGDPIPGGYKGIDAINKLREVQSGYVPDAFVRPDIGGIALPWGDDWMGLKHIIKDRLAQGIDPDKFLPKLADIIENGEKEEHGGRYYITKDGYLAVVSPTYFDDKFTFLLTGWDTTVPKAKK